MVDRLKHLSVAAKLQGGFLVVAVLCLVVGIVGYSGISRVSAQAEAVAQVGIHEVQAVDGVSDILERQLVRVVFDVNMGGRRLSDGADRLRTMQAEAAERIRAVEALEVHPQLEEEYEAFIAQAKQVEGLAATLQSAMASEDFALFNMVLANEYVPAMRPFGESVDALEHIQREIALQELAAKTAEQRRVTLLLLVMVGMALVLSVVLGFFITRAITGPLGRAVELAEGIARGDLSREVDFLGQDEIGRLGHAMAGMRGSLQEVVRTIGGSIEAGQAGRLDHRADAARFQGAYRELAEGLNQLVDAFVRPLRLTQDYMGRISAGDVPPRITEEYRGDFNEMRQSLNQLVEVMEGLTGEMTVLAGSAAAGDLTARGDAAAFQGAWGGIVSGVNDALEAMVTPIQEAQAVLGRVADRELTARMEGDYQGDFARMKVSLNQAVENLDEGMQRVQAAAEQVAAAAGQIGSGSQALAQGTSEQASTLEEVSSSLQELASMTQQNTSNAHETRGLTEAARQFSEKGMESMTRLSEAMERIKGSSDETAKIVKTIDEIAFQTNLLALNAAVEAARAGDAGKGFAVVAEEVRNLAMRSAEAAKDTAALIEESVRNAEGGVELNVEVTANLREITTQVGKVSEVMAEIAAASDQQSQGITEVTSAVEQMNQVTQQTAANAEESSSAAEELSGQAEEMQGLVGQFALSGSGVRSAPGRGASVRNASRTGGAVGSPASAGGRQGGRGGRVHAPKGRNGGSGSAHEPAGAAASRLIPFDDDETLSDF